MPFVVPAPATPSSGPAGGAPAVPQVAIPPRIGSDGRLVLIEQASAGEVAQRVGVLCRTPPGWLDGRPGFGLSDQAHLEGGADISEIERQIAVHVTAVIGEDTMSAIVEEDMTGMQQGLDVLGVTVTR